MRGSAALCFQMRQGVRSGSDIEQELRVKALAEANGDGGMAGMRRSPMGEGFFKGLDDRRHQWK